MIKHVMIMKINEINDNLIDIVAENVNKTVEKSKNIANSAADTTKTYVGSAKGRPNEDKVYVISRVALILTMC